MIEALGIRRKAAGRMLLAEVSLTIAAGERLALVGPSGSGKTLLLRAIALLDPVDAGQIRWHGNTVRGHNVPNFRGRVIYLAQRPALLEGTVEDNLRQPFALRIHRDKKFDRQRMLAFLESLGRDVSFLSKRQRNLSGGEGQLAALLRAIQLDPDVLLLDEPTAALDSEATEMVESLVATWHGQQPDRRSILWISHNLDQAHRMATSVRRIRNGRLENAL